MIDSAMIEAGDIIKVVKVIAIMAQLVYWMLLRDDGREQVVWNACLNLEVPMREVAVCGRRRKAL